MIPLNDKIEDFVVDLFKINAVKFGEFKLKVGIMSPIYFDLRVIVSYPKLMKQLSDLLVEVMSNAALKPNHICGVPYTALPIASLISVATDTSMIVRRKEAKDYGTKRMIEGIYNKGESCVIIEDVISSGSSILDTVRDLNNEGLVVKDAVVLLDREQGARDNLADKGVTAHVLVPLSKLLDILSRKGLISKQVVESVHDFIVKSQINTDGTFKSAVVTTESASRLSLSLSARALLATHPLTKRLLLLMEQKKSLLAVAADVETSEELLNVATDVGPHVAILKIHMDAVRDFSADTVKQLKSLANKFQFVIMEDRKFADIGNTVSLQFANVKDWAELVTVHSLPGPSIISGLKKSAGAEPRGGFLVAELSSQGALTNSAYAQETMRMAESNKDFVVGVVCQSRDLNKDPTLVQLTPGVQFNATGDNLGQQYTDPRTAVVEKGADIAVVGRGILGAKNRGETAKLYKESLWAAYCERIEEAVN